MNNTVLQKTIALRAEVWRELVNSSLFQSFKALDEAVSAMGGKRVLLAESVAQSDSQRSSAGNEMPAPRRRASQGDAAEAVLREAKEPMTIRPLLDAVTARGVEVRGEDPLANFRSTLSRDDRFKSIMRNGGYYWWFADADMPESWKEAETDDFAGLLVSAPISTSQEGGDGHAANNANLT